MKKIFSISITFSICILINAIILFELETSIFFEIDNAIGEIENSSSTTTNNNINKNNKTTNDTQHQQVIETQCKSPCPPNAEMCIEMCA